MHIDANVYKKESKVNGVWNEWRMRPEYVSNRSPEWFVFGVVSYNFCKLYLCMPVSISGYTRMVSNGRINPENYLEIICEFWYTKTNNL